MNDPFNSEATHCIEHSPYLHLNLHDKNRFVALVISPSFYCAATIANLWPNLPGGHWLRDLAKKTQKRWFPHLRQRRAKGKILQNSARKSLQVNGCPKKYNGQEFELHELWAIASGGACLHSITLCKAKYLKVKPNHNVSIVGLSLIRNTDIKQIDFAFCVLKAIISNIPLINKCSNVVLEVYGMDWVLWMSRRR